MAGLVIRIKACPSITDQLRKEKNTGKTLIIKSFTKTN